jgi:hypothetical protein
VLRDGSKSGVHWWSLGIPRCISWSLTRRPKATTGPGDSLEIGCDPRGLQRSRETAALRIPPFASRCVVLDAVGHANCGLLQFKPNGSPVRFLFCDGDFIVLH